MNADLSAEILRHLRPAYESLVRNEKYLIQCLAAKGYPATWIFGVQRGIEKSLSLLENPPRFELKDGNWQPVERNSGRTTPNPDWDENAL